ncbi:MAG: hypothetical protein ACOYD4_07725 [Solirubrobacterales bacterium]
MPKASGALRRRIWLAPAGALVLALVVFAGGLRPADAAPPRGAGASQLLLRLDDLPPGYLVLADRSEGRPAKVTCGALRPGDPRPAVAAYVKRHSPAGCLLSYARIYQVPGEESTPDYIGTAALRAPSGAAARVGMELAPAALSLAERDRLRKVKLRRRIGDATHLFHWRSGPPTPDERASGRMLGTYLLWRSGNVLALVFAGGGTIAENDRAAVGLARRQQKHVEAPTPYTAAERYDLEVLLDDPAIKGPVYWLGRSFAPGGELPVAHLVGGGLEPAPTYDRRPRAAVSVGYTKRIRIDTWSAGAWKRYLASPAGARVLSWHCTEATQVPLAGGSATVYAAYASDYKRCPSRPPDRYFAVVPLGKAVVVVDYPTYRGGNSDFGGPYNSLAGVNAIIQGLARRPKPDY